MRKTDDYNLEFQHRTDTVYKLTKPKQNSKIDPEIHIREKNYSEQIPRSFGVESRPLFNQSDLCGSTRQAYAKRKCKPPVTNFKY